MNVTTRQKTLAAWIFAALGLACMPALAGPVEEIHEVEDRRYDAMIRMDADALAHTLADEFYYHQANGKTNDKPGYIRQTMSGTVKIFTAERYDVKVHTYGNVATVMGDTRLDLEIGGERRKADLRYINVWVQRDGRWQLTQRQSAFK